jgi:hypothetical protein
MTHKSHEHHDYHRVRYILQSQCSENEAKSATQAANCDVVDRAEAERTHSPRRRTFRRTVVYEIWCISRASCHLPSASSASLRVRSGDFVVHLVASCRSSVFASSQCSIKLSILHLDSVAHLGFFPGSLEANKEPHNAFGNGSLAGQRS